jgi:hypothetical protein
MQRVTAVLVFATLFTTPAAVRGQNASSALSDFDVRTLTAPTLPIAATTNATMGGEATEPLLHQPVRQATAGARKRPFILLALYAGSAILQAYDTYSTLSALRAGGQEGNPVMKGIVKSPALFIGLKAGASGLSIGAADQLWKEHHHGHAIATMAISDSFMTVVAINNARVLGSLR